MAITYPRHCACCNYTANYQQAWSKHIKTAKHISNSQDGCPVVPTVPVSPNPISTSPTTVEALLTIIQQQAATIHQQAESIKTLTESIQRHECAARAGGSEVQPLPSSPSVTLNISELVSKQPNTRVKHHTTPHTTQCNTPCDITTSIDATETPTENIVLNPCRDAAPPDNALNVSDVLEPDFHIGTTTDEEILQANIIKRFTSLSRGKRPIRYHKGIWEYKQNDVWHEGAQDEVHQLIYDRLRQQYRELDDYIGVREPTDLEQIQFLCLGSCMGSDSINLWQIGALTQANCKV